MNRGTKPTTRKGAAKTSDLPRLLARAQSVEASAYLAEGDEMREKLFLKSAGLYRRYVRLAT